MVVAAVNDRKVCAREEIPDAQYVKIIGNSMITIAGTATIVGLGELGFFSGIGTVAIIAGVVFAMPVCAVGVQTIKIDWDEIRRCQMILEESRRLENEKREELNNLPLVDGIVMDCVCILGNGEIKDVKVLLPLPVMIEPVDGTSAATQSEDSESPIGEPLPVQEAFPAIPRVGPEGFEHWPIGLNGQSVNMQIIGAGIIVKPIPSSGGAEGNNNPICCDCFIIRDDGNLEPATFGGTMPIAMPCDSIGMPHYEEVQRLLKLSQVEERGQPDVLEPVSQSPDVQITPDLSVE